MMLQYDTKQFWKNTAINLTFCVIAVFYVQMKKWSAKTNIVLFLYLQPVIGFNYNTEFIHLLIMPPVGTYKWKLLKQLRDYNIVKT